MSTHMLLCLALVFIMSPGLARASHIVGTDLYYTHISGNTYKVTIVLNGDCRPLSAGDFSTLPTSFQHLYLRWRHIPY